MKKWIVSEKKHLMSRINHLKIWIECMTICNYRLMINMKDIQNSGINKLINQNRNLSEKCKQPNSSNNGKHGSRTPPTQKPTAVITRQSIPKSSMKTWLCRQDRTTQPPLPRELPPMNKLWLRKRAQAQQRRQESREAGLRPMEWQQLRALLKSAKQAHQPTWVKCREAWLRQHWFNSIMRMTMTTWFPSLLKA